MLVGKGMYSTCIFNQVPLKNLKTNCERYLAVERLLLSDRRAEFSASIRRRTSQLKNFRCKRSRFSPEQRHVKIHFRYSWNSISTNWRTWSRAASSGRTDKDWPKRTGTIAKWVGWWWSGDSRRRTATRAGFQWYENRLKPVSSSWRRTMPPCIDSGVPERRPAVERWTCTNYALSNCPRRNSTCLEALMTGWLLQVEVW